MQDTPDLAPRFSGLTAALPFWLSLGMIPLAIISAALGGWTVFRVPLYGDVLRTRLDAVRGLNEQNADTSTEDRDVFWYRLITLVWFPIQFVLIYGMIWYATRADHLTPLELVVLFFGVGLASGAVGINYSHELMHQKNRLERWLADLLLATVLYSHFRSEHLLVHHRYVGTPRDTVTARYNESFHRFFWRVLRDGTASAWRAEVQRLEKAGRDDWHRSNPFWLYAGLQMAAVFLALLVGGWLGLVLFLWQAFIAIWQLELVNYIEHYGLTRVHLGDGRYEHVRPRHSWNAAHTASNWLLINLQRHSDHHYKPDRRFPLLQTYTSAEAPQLPLGYPAMTALAMIPPLWRRRMNPRVRAWRKRFYPEITDWSEYNEGGTPMPAGAD